VKMMNDTRSRAPRFTVGGLKVIYDTGDTFWSAPVVDVSESGIFVETTHTLAPGTRVVLMPDTPEEDQLPFEIHGVVVRSIEYDLDRHWDRTPGIAFRLEGLTVENFELLRTFLRSHGVGSRQG